MVMDSRVHRERGHQNVVPPVESRNFDQYAVITAAASRQHGFLVHLSFRKDMQLNLALP